MIDALVMTLALSSVPDHLLPPTEKAVTIEVDEAINYKKPMRGGFTEEISEAMRVPKKWKPFTRCILDRESGANLENTNSGEGAQNPTSSASGRFQFLDNSWRDGLSHMVAGRLKDNGVPRTEVKGLRVWLETKPIHKWDGVWQQVGYNAVIEAGGWYHWRNGDKCDGRRP